MRGLYRSEESMVLGVCGGIARAFDLNTFGVRLLAFLLILGSGGAGLLIYFALALAMKPEPGRYRY